MTVPTNIPETPMVDTEHKALHRSKGTKHSIPMEVLQHVLKTVLGIRDDDQIDSFSQCPTEVTMVLMIFVNIFTVSQVILKNMLNTE